MRLKEILEEDVGGNYLYHATSGDPNTIKSILSNGLKTNTVNAERNGTNTPTVSFTRNPRYALTAKDDAGRAVSGIANGVVLVFDGDTVRRIKKPMPVAHSGNSINSFNTIQKTLTDILASGVDTSRMRVTMGAGTKPIRDAADAIEEIIPEASMAEVQKYIGSPGIRFWIDNITKPFFAAPSQETLDTALSYFNIGKKYIMSLPGVSRGKSQGASEYEEVVPYNGTHIPIRTLGLVGYFLNPAVDEDRGNQIREIFNKSGVKEFDQFGANRTRTSQTAARAKAQQPQQPAVQQPPPQQPATPVQQPQQAVPARNP